MSNPLLKGNINLCQMDMPEDLVKFSGNFTDKFRAHGFQELTNKIPQNISTGWVDPLDLSDSEEFPNIRMESYFVVGVRIDAFKFSQAQIKPIFDRLVKEKSLVGLSLSRQTKLELKEAAFNQLRGKSAPASRIEYVVFDFVNKQITILSKVKSVVSKITTLLTETFMDVCRFENEPVANFFKDFVEGELPDLPADCCGLWLFRKAREGFTFFSTDFLEMNIEATLILADAVKFKNQFGTDFSIKYKPQGNDITLEEFFESENTWKNIKLEIIQNNVSWEFNLDIETTDISTIKIHADSPVSTAISERIADRLNNLFILPFLLKSLGSAMVTELREKEQLYG